MHGVSRISVEEDIMMISYTDADAQFMAQTLNRLADAGVVVDMISQTPPRGKHISFGFSAPNRYVETVLRALGGEDKTANPMVSGGYTKVYLFGEEMVASVGVAARVLATLNAAGADIAMITTSDLDISLLVRAEDADVAVQSLRGAFAL
jgi:aspartate kinase